MNKKKEEKKSVFKQDWGNEYQKVVDQLNKNVEQCEKFKKEDDKSQVFRKTFGGMGWGAFNDYTDVGGDAGE